MRRIFIEPGTRFGRLVVTHFAGVSKHGQGSQHCLCDCGRRVVRRSGDLLRGRTVSCEIGECHRRWLGGRENLGSEAWARRRIDSLKRQSRRSGYAEPYEGADRVLDLWHLCGGVCACCREPSETTLHLDHCHETGRLRGFVCRVCNTCIGLASEHSSKLVCMAVWVTSQPA